MSFSNLAEENETSETTSTYVDRIDKDKVEPVDEATMKKFKKDNKIVRECLLNHMTNPLLDLFVTLKSTKIIWEKMEIKHVTNDVRKK